MVWKKSNKSFPRLCLYPTPFRCKARISIKRKKDERKEGGTPRGRKIRKKSDDQTDRTFSVSCSIVLSKRLFNLFVFFVTKNHPIYKLGARSNFYL